MNQPAARIEGHHRRPALRLVSTKDLPRSDWLEVRKTGIGSSDAAAAVGLNPYCSALELWMNKTGKAPNEDATADAHADSEDSSPTYWGTVLEAIVAAHYTRKTGNRVRKVNAVLQHSNPDLPWMLANLDREVVGSPDVQILECKTAGMNGARLWADGVPQYVQLQVMHQLAVTGKQAADVAVLVCGNDFRVHRIERDEAMITNLIQLEQAFWHHVQSDTPPPADGSDSSDRALRRLFPCDSGQVVDFRGDRELCAAYADWVSLREVLTRQEALEASLLQRMQQAMGEATQAVFETGSVRWKKVADSTVLDTARLLQDNPTLMQRYSKTRTGARRFTNIETKS